MADHLNLGLQIFVFHSKLSKGVQHHGFTFVICRLEMFIYGIVDLFWGLSIEYQKLGKLSHNK
jgi:hypothetical protein